jgi:hypothetical protein
VTVRPIKTEDIEQESFRDSVFPHDGDRDAAALCSEFNDAIVVEVQQAVPLEPRDRLRHRGHRLLESFGEASAKGGLSLFFELEDDFEIHLGRVNQIGHVHPLCFSKIPSAVDNS